MTDLPLGREKSLFQQIDKVWLLILLLPLGLAVIDFPNTGTLLSHTFHHLKGTAPFILFAVAAIGVLKATGAESLLVDAFKGNEMRMVFFAALAGGISPFCSCEVIPFIAALLAAGAPLSAVMAFWLASPLMDPAMFAITAGAMGTEFAVAKLFAAVSLATLGGLATMGLSRVFFTGDILRNASQKPCCSSGLKGGKPVWRFWTESERLSTFKSAATTNFWFLIKWMTLAYLIASLMEIYIPSELVSRVAGGEGVGPVILAALVGAPAYLNGYGAPALASTFVAQGMSQGAAMSFLIAGGVTCIPAAIAVWGLVKPRVFSLYLLLGFTGAISAGIVWNLIS